MIDVCFIDMAQKCIVGEEDLSTVSEFKVLLIFVLYGAKFELGEMGITSWLAGLLVFVKMFVEQTTAKVVDRLQ